MPTEATLSDSSSSHSTALTTPSPPTNSNLLSDIFSDSRTPSPDHTHDSTAGPSRRILSELPHVEYEHSTAGYREGLLAGKENAAQTGFDQGYMLGAAIGGVAGYLLGILEGVCAVVKDGGVHEMLGVAKRELSLEVLLGEEYVDQDANYMWDVETQGEDVTVVDVAREHPLLKKWAGQVDEVQTRFGISKDVLEKRWHQHDGEDAG